jgi:hypothetical protein
MVAKTKKTTTTRYKAPTKKSLLTKYSNVLKSVGSSSKDKNLSKNLTRNINTNSRKNLGKRRG